MKPGQLKILKDKLPELPGINGREDFINSVVFVPLVIIDDECCLLFEKRNPKIRQGGEVCFPGGIYDPEKDSSRVNTALRETLEEIGIGKDRISILGALDAVVAPLGTIVDACIGLMHIDSLDELVINHDEVDYVFTVPLSHFEFNEPEIYHTRVFAHPFYNDSEGNKITLFPSEELGVPEMYHKPWGGRNLKVYVYRYGNEIIWGITARFVFDVVNKIRQGSA